MHQFGSQRPTEILRKCQISRRVGTEFVQLSCEIEGHALGGGMLKLEPREATEVLLPRIPLKRAEPSVIADALQTMRSWRHYAKPKAADGSACQWQK